MSRAPGLAGDLSQQRKGLNRGGGRSGGMGCGAGTERSEKEPLRGQLTNWEGEGGVGAEVEARVAYRGCTEGPGLQRSRKAVPER